MNIKQLILPSIALSAAAGLVIPAKTEAFTTLGNSLTLSLREFRIFDNFTDPESNDNVTPDPNFPGYTGCELAIWKACTEWGSRLHGGTGDGDPHQPGGLGSGGANFDAVFQGNATAVGGSGSNTFSEISGSSGGVLGYTEISPFNDGFRIRFYSNWTWDDGPGTTITGRDIQGVATQLYGFALGLGTSTVPGATMNSPIDPEWINTRSIEADDIAGVRFVYGTASAAKPRITGISYSGGRLTIHGSNFNLSANDVWFTPNTATAADVPVQVVGLPSDGSQITLAIPPTAGSGDVFVKPQIAGNWLSNGWPIDSASFPPPPGSAYCFGDGSLPTPCPCVPPNTVPSPSGAPDAGCANSFDLDGARLTAAGGTSPDSVVFTTLIGGNSAAFGLLLKGNGSDANGVANGDGVRCVDGQLIRFGGHNAGTNGAPLGTWTYPNSVQTTPVSMATLQSPGQSAYYQLYYRNLADLFCTSALTNMSNGFQIDW